MTTGLNKLRATRPSDNAYDIKFQKLDLSPQRFNALIDQYGIRLQHEKVTLCPNYTGPITSQQHDPNCTLCENSYIHYDSREIIGFFNTNDMVRNFMRGGFWEMGSAMLSVPSYFPVDSDDQVYLNLFDKIVLLDFEDRFYEVIHKSDDSITRLRYKALKVEFLRTAKKIYEQDNQFVIDENGDIKWLTEDRPTKDPITNLGELMTISYLYRPVYRVTQMLHEGRFTQRTFKQPKREQVRMPQQAMIKKDFLIDKKDKDGNLISEPLLP